MSTSSVAILDEREIGTMPAMSRGHLVLGGLAFACLTVAVFAWLFARVSDVSAPALKDLRWGYLLPLLAVLPVESLASATRVWLICRVLHPGVSFGVCLQAELAYAAGALVTPSHSAGGLGQVYLLKRRAGVPVGTGVTATLLSFMGTMVGLLLMGLYTCLISGIAASGALFLAPVAVLMTITALLVVGAMWPDRCRVVLATLSRAACRFARRPEALREWRPPGTPEVTPGLDRMDTRTGRLVDLLYAYRDGLRRFLRHGKACGAAVGLLSVVFLLARALTPYLCARFLGVEGGTLRQIVEAQMALIVLVFFAPTPGGAGIAEGASLSLMADIVPAAIAPYYNLLWRVSTTYLAALAGFVVLGRVLARDSSSLARRQPEPR
jgi:glycosyltransferase 2 family protein